MKNFFKLTALLILVLTLTACEEDDDNLASVVQKCLNGVPVNGGVTEANACLAKAGSSTDARVLRAKCALKFISNGIAKQEMIDAFKTMVNNPSTGSPMINLANQIAAPSLGAANDLVSTCEASSSVALTMIANASKLGFLAQDAAGTDDINQVADGTNLATMDPALVGQIAVSIAATYCAGGKQDEVCNAISQQNSGCSPTDVVCLGNFLKDICLENPSCGNTP